MPGLLPCPLKSTCNAVFLSSLLSSNLRLVQQFQKSSCEGVTRRYVFLKFPNCPSPTPTIGPQPLFLSFLVPTFFFWFMSQLQAVRRPSRRLSALHHGVGGQNRRNGVSSLFADSRFVDFRILVLFLHRHSFPRTTKTIGSGRLIEVPLALYPSSSLGTIFVFLFGFGVRGCARSADRDPDTTPSLRRTTSFFPLWLVDVYCTNHLPPARHRCHPFSIHTPRDSYDW